MARQAVQTVAADTLNDLFVAMDDLYVRRVRCPLRRRGPRQRSPSRPRYELRRHGVPAPALSVHSRQRPRRRRGRLRRRLAHFWSAACTHVRTRMSAAQQDLACAYGLLYENALPCPKTRHRKAYSWPWGRCCSIRLRCLRGTTTPSTKIELGDGDEQREALAVEPERCSCRTAFGWRRC